MKELNILGRYITLHQKDKKSLRGVNIGDTLSYTFYDGVYLGMDMLFLKPKESTPTPLTCSITGKRLTELFKLPVVFILSPAPSYERQRLIDKNVFFVMGEQFAFLPMLIANERTRKTRPAKRFSLVAQYILLYHLQVECLEGKSARDMAEKLPYSYESITLGLTCLEDLGVCEKVVDGSKTKTVHFHSNGRDLWNSVQDYLIDPIEKRVYCDDIDSEVKFLNCNINALSHYTWLNPDKCRMIMMNKKQFKELAGKRAFHNLNEFDGNIMIEVWKYPVVSKQDDTKDWVDKLSLAISLKEDEDPRVEGEVERLINEIEWKD